MADIVVIGGGAAGIMELVPMIGSGFLYLVLSVVYFLNGETAVGWQLLGLTLGLQTLRRLVEPKIVSNVMSISPLQGLIGMFVGMKVGGVIGLIGGPVAMAVLVGAIRGRIFEGMKQDIRTVAAYFRERWKPAENKETVQETTPPEPEA